MSEIRITFRVPELTYAKLVAEAKRSERTISQLLRLLISQHFSK